MKYGIQRIPSMAFILQMGLIVQFRYDARGCAQRFWRLSRLAGASAAVWASCGLGEFVGYSLRLLTGVLRINEALLLLTSCGTPWTCSQFRACLVPQNGGCSPARCVLHRVGKASKNPRKRAISFAASRRAAGVRRSGILDQIVAFLGPLILFFVLLVRRTAIPSPTIGCAFWCCIPRW
jgi:hypothetical protein